MELQSGKSLQGGKYTIIRSLGQGGFGITYLAQQDGLSRQVAIKEFFMKDFCNREDTSVHIANESNRATVESCKRKFLNEAKNIAALNNAHIVRIYDVFEENGTAYYVMELLEKGSMKDKIEVGGPLQEAAAISYITQVAEALYHTHRQNILHLDIKPANIMMNAYNQAVLIDFGISRRYACEGGATSTNTVGVSEGFSPLEQYALDGARDLTPETDIYSLGATLYYMLTGTKPPKAATVNESGLPSLPAGVSASTSKAIKKAMSPRRADRYHGVKEFIEALGGKLSVIDDTPGDDGTILMPVAPVDPGKPKEPKKPLPWKKIGVAAAIALAAVACIIAGFCLAPKIKEASERKKAEQELRIQREQFVADSLAEAARLDSIAREKAVRDSIARAKSRGTTNYGGFATYSGALRNGKPGGSGKIKFTSSHVIDSRDPQQRVAEVGDYVQGSFKDGRLIQGNWYDSDGNKKGFIMIGE